MQDPEPAISACCDPSARARIHHRQIPAAAADRQEGHAVGRADPDQRARVLADLRAAGMTIGECIRALATAGNDPYITAARASILGDDDVEIDDETVTAPGDGGAWVLAWLWVGDGQAGVLTNSAMLEEVLSRARRTLECAGGMEPEARRLLDNQADWLEDLLTNMADELDTIGSARPASEPGAILWIDGQGRDTLFMPSDAVRNLFELAKLGGLDIRHADHCKWFCSKHGTTLDAVVSAVRLG
ncbi:hypothetical protein [Ottowia sp.]|uniref:hypothetical protein n=1 Tax=Ottowia sp. TaxID=1898956 RepID=UPI00260DE15D|nr:hypothetical protein [Ottowia sp.]